MIEGDKKKKKRTLALGDLSRNTENIEYHVKEILSLKMACEDTVFFI